MIGKELIREYARSIGLDPVGFAGAHSFERLREMLEERHGKGYLSGFEAGTVDERIHPRLHLEEARSIIAAGLPYLRFSGQEDMCGIDGSAGIISGSAAGEDYHRVLKGKLEQLAVYISRETPNFKYLIMVDTGPLVDREVAYRAGLGFYGKNCSIIAPSLGSGIFLGEMLVNIELEPDSVLDMDCGECGICLEKCPTGALVKPYTLDVARCISYLTQKKGIIPRELRSRIGVHIYGCDRCQRYCPYNNKALGQTDEGVIVDIKELMEMGKRGFAERYKNSAAGWRGLNILKRNAVVALGNLKRGEDLDLLVKAIIHPSPVIRGHAAWAAGRIGGERAEGILIKALHTEKDEYVLDEIKKAIAEM